MVIIPLESVPNQTLRVTLGGQDCTIELRTLSTGLFITLSVSGSPIISTAYCGDRNLLVREAYLGFIGDLSFVDLQGHTDPEYSGLGERWVLYYFAPTDL